MPSVQPKAATVAVRAPGPGEVLLETLFVSVDPAMRVWISENPGYVQRIDPGDTMRGSGIARAEVRISALFPGDIKRKDGKAIPARES